VTTSPQASHDPQTSLYETTIESPELELALEDRATKKAAAAAARKKADGAHEVVVELVAKLDLADAPVRIGGYVVQLKATNPRSVSFETAAGTRLSIKPLPEL
jgi:hypothetical protein